MKNNKVIVLCGYARGGTNIAWNILQSHPKICSPIYETGELFRTPKLFIARWLVNPLVADLSKEIIDSQLFKYKLKNLEYPDNKFIREDELYSREDVINSVLCLESVNQDILLTDLLLDVYPDLYFIGLTRNGYSLADGYIRRGETAAEAGNLYYDIAMKMKDYSAKIENFKLIKFEDCISKPFRISEDLFSFLNLSPKRLDKIRLKSKKVIKLDGSHSVTFGKEDRKYWFDQKSIKQALDPGVNQKQANRLTTELIRDFNQEAGQALDFFGYLKQEV